MKRDQFIKSLKIPLAGISSSINLNFNLLQKSVAAEFENNGSFIVISPRQTGRTLSIIVNLLYELSIGQCKDTIIISRTLLDARRYLFQISQILELNPTLNDNIKLTKKGIRNKLNQFINFETTNSVQKLSKEKREEKRLIIIDASYINDSTLIFKLVDGWDTVIMEVIPAPVNKFNSIFIKNLIDFNGLGIFNIINYNYKQLKLKQKWFSNQKQVLSPELFKREILLEW